jgi:His-Xaa-Ser system protein HxsD
VQRAVYRLSDRISCDITETSKAIEVTVHIPGEDKDSEAILADLRNEVLDQVLRERIRSETEDVRKLILAMAFSKTGLAGEDV